jgi:hypothetical protein
MSESVTPVPLERWLPVVGWEDLYGVSCRGRVRGVDRWIPHRGGLRFHAARILKAAPHDAGYPKVNLHRGAGHRPVAVYVHRLVLEAFAGPCPPGMEACHGPGGPDDNRWPESGLHWGTPEENNTADKLRDGTLLRGEQIATSKLTATAVLEIRQALARGEQQQVIAARYGVRDSLISRIKTGKRWAWL